MLGSISVPALHTQTYTDISHRHMTHKHTHTHTHTVPVYIHTHYTNVTHTVQHAYSSLMIGKIGDRPTTF